MSSLYIIVFFGFSCFVRRKREEEGRARGNVWSLSLSLSFRSFFFGSLYLSLSALARRARLSLFALEEPGRCFLLLLLRPPSFSLTVDSALVSRSSFCFLCTQTSPCARKDYSSSQPLLMLGPRPALPPLRARTTWTRTKLETPRTSSGTKAPWTKRRGRKLWDKKDASCGLPVCPARERAPWRTRWNTSCLREGTK